MPRIFRALVISAVATTTAVAVSALLKNREFLSGLQTRPQPRSAPRATSPAVSDLSSEEEKILLAELEQHV